MRNVRVLGDHVLVRRHSVAERTAGGLHIPEQARDPAIYGTVVAVGPGSHVTQGADFGKLVPVELKPGDVVVFRQHGPFDFNIDGVKHTILREVDILGIVEEMDAKPVFDASPAFDIADALLAAAEAP